MEIIYATLALKHSMTPKNICNPFSALKNQLRELISKRTNCQWVTS